MIDPIYAMEALADRWDALNERLSDGADEDDDMTEDARLLLRTDMRVRSECAAELRTILELARQGPD